MQTERFGVSPGARFLSESLPDFFSSKRANAVQAKREDNAVFVAQPNVECVVLYRNRAALPRVAQGRGRTDERAIAGEWMLLKIEEQRHAAEQTLIPIAEKD